jgi:DNA ligase-associated metallophosphoesterase
MVLPQLHIIHNQHFWLTTQRCIFWEEEKALILSDLHFGKTGHFRKNGIAVPQKVYKEDLQRLAELISHFKPEKLILVGDLFHSVDNKEMDLFLKWRQDLHASRFILVKGNHDILKEEWYEKAAIEVIKGSYMLNSFRFVHDPAEMEESVSEELYTFSGHLHPGVSIKGLGKQNLTFPCYYFSDRLAILPAFSKFSGLAIIKKKKKDIVFAIVNQSLVAIQ